MQTRPHPTAAPMEVVDNPLSAAPDTKAELKVAAEASSPVVPLPDFAALPARLQSILDFLRQHNSNRDIAYAASILTHTNIAGLLHIRAVLAGYLHILENKPLTPEEMKDEPICRPLDFFALHILSLLHSVTNLQRLTVPNVPAINYLIEEILIALQAYEILLYRNKDPDLYLASSEACYKTLASTIVKHLFTLPDQKQFVIAAGWSGHSIYITAIRSRQNEDAIFFRIDNYGRGKSSYFPATHRWFANQRLHDQAPNTTSNRRQMFPRYIGKIGRTDIENAVTYIARALWVDSTNQQRNQAIPHLYNFDHLLANPGTQLPAKNPSFLEQQRGNCVAYGYQTGMQLRLNAALPGSTLKTILSDQESHLSQLKGLSGSSLYKFQRQRRSFLLQPHHIYDSHLHILSSILRKTPDRDNAYFYDHTVLSLWRTLQKPSYMLNKLFKPVIRELASLQQLNFNHQELTDEDIPYLINILQYLPALKTLSLHGNKISVQGEEKLAIAAQANRPQQIKITFSASALMQFDKKGSNNKDAIQPSPSDHSNKRHASDHTPDQSPAKKAKLA